MWGERPVREEGDSSSGPKSVLYFPPPPRLRDGPLLICLADFTALLVDIIGNSTSYLTEIFKSTSILSGMFILELLGRLRYSIHHGIYQKVVEPPTPTPAMGQAAGNGAVSFIQTIGVVQF